MVGRKKRTRLVEDKITHLPDHLISHILTRLSTRDVVRTSVLSTRWRNLWQLVAELDSVSKHQFRSFGDFVSFAGRFFDLHKDSWIPKLSLTIHDLAGPSYLTSWIDVVTRRRIQHLDLSVVCIHCYGSPVLEDLTIIRNSTENAKVLQVRSKTLKRIHVNEFVHVVIDAPLLQCIKTSFYLKKNVTVIHSGFPAKVDIDFGGAPDLLHPNGVSKRKVISEILTDISRVRELVISSYNWKDIFPSLESGPLLYFCYLSRLTATFCNSDLVMLPNLLKSCPKLESLTLTLSANHRYIRGTKNNEPKFTVDRIMIPCVVLSLKVVELKSPILGYEGEMELVRYFLKNTLEKMRVTFSGHHRRKRVKATEVILKELLAMPRSSSACQLVVV